MLRVFSYFTLKFIMRTFLSSLLLIASLGLYGQTAQDFQHIVEAVSADRLQKDISTLANFGTRHTLSDTLSAVRGIGAARRWIKKEFDQISTACGGAWRFFIKKIIMNPMADVSLNPYGSIM